MAQLRQQEKAFASEGVSVACVLGLDEVRTRYFAKNKPADYTALSDVSARVDALYGVAKQLFVHEEWVNAPAAYVIADGVVRWNRVGRSWSGRPSIETILEEVRRARR